MKQAQDTITVGTRGQGLHEVTAEIADWVSRQDIGAGLLTVFCRHTSASLTSQENADPDVQRDLEAFFKRLVEEERRCTATPPRGPTTCRPISAAPSPTSPSPSR